jgi:hypothetical protein
MDSGRRIHVPVLKCRIPFSICKELGEFLLSWQVGQAKNHPRRSRHYKAFQGIFPITQKSSQKSTTTCGLASARCVFNGSLSIFLVVQMKSDEEQMVAYTYWFPACLELWLASEDFVG